MKWCQTHWDALREGCAARDLTQFIPETGEEAFENTVLELEGHGSGFDPLSGSMWQLTNKVMDNIGRSQGPGAVLATFGDPEWCPMCAVQESFDWFDTPEAKAQGAERTELHLDAQAWIDQKLDSARRYADEQGFFKRGATDA